MNNYLKKKKQRKSQQILIITRQERSERTLLSRETGSFNNLNESMSYSFHCTKCNWFFVFVFQGWECTDAFWVQPCIFHGMHPSNDLKHIYLVLYCKSDFKKFCIFLMGLSKYFEPWPTITHKKAKFLELYQPFRQIFICILNHCPNPLHIFCNKWNVYLWNNLRLI